MTRRPEQALHIAVADFLRVALPAHVIWNHVPNGGARSKAEAGIFKEMGVRAGWPDIQIIHKGRLYGIELKADRRKPSDAQEKCHADLMLAGADVDTCRSLDEVERRLKLWGIPLIGRIAA
jgi:hypothetical protein